MERATAVPPGTASEPPSQKSFCTSTMMSARTETLYCPRGDDPPAPPDHGGPARPPVPPAVRSAQKARRPHTVAEVTLCLLGVGGEDGGDGRVAARQLQRVRGQLGESLDVPRPRVGKRLAPDDLPVA